MKKVFLYFIFPIFLVSTLSANALNPKPYAALGDVIYDNVAKIEKLQNIDNFKVYNTEIQKYLDDVADAKKEGYALELKKATVNKKDYLSKLRALSTRNDAYIRDIKNSYKRSMKQNDHMLFSQIINNELIDVDANKKEIIDYYYLHSDDINSSGVIDAFLEEDARLKALKEAELKKRKSKKTLQEEKIRRIREQDLEAKKRLEKQLEQDVIRKKIEIREKQKKELAD